MKALLGKARNYLDRYVWRRVTGAAAVIIQAAVSDREEARKSGEGLGRRDA
jgi:hypothetical protein